METGTQSSVELRKIVFLTGELELKLKEFRHLDKLKFGK
jgi:hypothetical protein